MARINNEWNYRTLKEGLNDYYRVYELTELAGLANIINTPTRKAEIIDAITVAMNGEQLKKNYNRLNRIEQCAVAEAAYAKNGIFDFKKFKAKYQGEIYLSPRHGYRTNNIRVDLFIINSQVPEDLMIRLKSFVAKPALDTIKYVKKLPGSIRSVIKGDPTLPLEIRKTSQAALSNLETILRLIDGGKLKVSPKTGRPTAATIKYLSKLLYDGDWYNDNDLGDDTEYIQSFALPILIQAGKLAIPDGNKLKLTKAGQKALSGNLQDTIKTVWKRWEKTKIIDEFSRINEIKGQKSSRGRTLTDVAKRRPIINDALKKCFPEQWIKIDELIRFMHANDIDFEVARYAWKLYVLDSQYGHLDDYSCGSLVEGRYFLVYLFEYAATLGLIDIAYTHPAGALSDFYDLWCGQELEFLSRYDGLKFIRLNSLGAYVLGITDKYVPEPIKIEQILKVLPNHDIVITDANALSPADKLFLEKTCKKSSSSLWQISMKTILDAAQNGTTPDEMLLFLKSRSSEKIPKTVTTLLNDAKKRSTKLIYSGRAHLIECKDPILGKMVCSDSKLSKMCRPAGKDYIVVLPGKEKSFEKALASLGYIVPQYRDQI